MGFAHLAGAMWHFLTSGAAKHPRLSFRSCNKSKKTQIGKCGTETQGLRGCHERLLHNRWSLMISARAES